MDRKSAIQEYLKMVEEGRPFSEDIIGKTRDIEDDALRARNLSGEALANQVLKDTGIPIPGKEASRLKQEDFLNRIVKERYPELEPNVVLEPSSSAGGYAKGKIDINSDLAKIWTPERKVGTLLHEAGHQYDDEILNKAGKNLDLGTLRKLKDSGVDLKSMDPTEVYELYAKNHHANIPGLREGTFELGALKNYLKKGTFRGIAPAILKGAGAIAGGAATLAAEASDSEEEGSSAEQAALLREIDDRKMREKNLAASPEMRAAFEKMYEEADTGKMFDARRDALRNLVRK
jgi:hypothetical protein